MTRIAPPNTRRSLEHSRVMAWRSTSRSTGASAHRIHGGSRTSTSQAAPPAGRRPSRRMGKPTRPSRRWWRPAVSDPSPAVLRRSDADPISRLVKEALQVRHSELAASALHERHAHSRPRATAPHLRPRRERVSRTPMVAAPAMSTGRTMVSADPARVGSPRWRLSGWCGWSRGPGPTHAPRAAR